jgi:hypothetical protein
MFSSTSVNREGGSVSGQLTERRSAVRYPVNADVTCPMVVPIKEELGAARIRDVSTEGIGLLLSKHVEPGTFLMVTLKNDAQKFFRIQLVQVAHSTKAAGGYVIGGNFVTPLSYEELSKLLM